MLTKLTPGTHITINGVRYSIRDLKLSNLDGRRISNDLTITAVRNRPDIDGVEKIEITLDSFAIAVSDLAGLIQVLRAP